jgi:CheY-like chemotaxis protein
LTYFQWTGTLEAKPMARVLVIDDEQEMRVLLELLLKSAGHEVILAVDGREGVERYRTSPADLVITDLYMPIQDGAETIQELRSCYPEVAVIAMSGSADTGAILSIAQNLATVEILRKPFLNDELIAAVAKALEGQSRSR